MQAAANGSEGRPDPPAGRDPQLRQDNWVSDLGVIEDPQDRLAEIVEWARGVDPLPEALKVEANRVRGCVSAVWVVVDGSAACLRVRGDADSPLVRGLVLLLCDLYDGCCARRVLEVEPQIWQRVGLADRITPTRRQGLEAVRAHLRRRAEERVASPGEGASLALGAGGDPPPKPAVVGEGQRVEGGLPDAHLHLQDPALRPHLPDLLRILPALGIGPVVVNGTHPEDWEAVADLARRHSWVIPAFGVHPWRSGRLPPGWEHDLRARLRADHRAGVGEVGLDSWVVKARESRPWLEARSCPAHPEVQEEIFRRQWSVARELGRPVSVHCLDSWETLLRVVEGVDGPEAGFLMHAYSGSWETAGRLLARGARFSFSPSFLGRPGGKAEAVFQRLPMDRLLVETDAPSRAPAPAYRRWTLPDDAMGRAVHHPANLLVALEGLAALRGVSRETLAAAVRSGFRALFEAAG